MRNRVYTILKIRYTTLKAIYTTLNVIHTTSNHHPKNETPYWPKTVGAAAPPQQSARRTATNPISKRVSGCGLGYVSM
ncbi:hypothetical protein [Planomicrobium okeanokoites]|uniref:hypothetical protein n=1 Tax=Planomicrobium okeanokoites TaxID=244 RepID=UPI00248F625A|nr:hypothetical protein [Planomicrobium okeanokoites]